MKKLKKLFRVPELYLGLLLVVFGILVCMGNVVGKNIVVTRDGKTKETAFPIMENMKKGML